MRPDNPVGANRCVRPVSVILQSPQSLRSVEMTLFAVADTAAVPYVVVSRGPPFWAFIPNTVYCKKKWRPCGRHCLLWIYLFNYLTSTFLVSITPLL